jgi:hypothetical protein
MKTLLSILGVISISASGGSAAILAKNQPTIAQQGEKQNTLKLNKNEDDLSLQISNLTRIYHTLSDQEKTIIAQEMEKLPELNSNEINQYLANSKIDFIRNNKEAIETMYLLSTSISQISEYSLPTPQLDIDWMKINEFLDLNFGDSNEYSLWANAYGPAHWWTAIWDWGLKVDFSEGIINIMRLAKLGFSFYNGLDFAPLESLTRTLKNLFDYLNNIDHHGNDEVNVLHDLILQAENKLKETKVPLNKKISDIIYLARNLLEHVVEGTKVSEITELIKKAFEAGLKVSLEEISSKFSEILNTALLACEIGNTILDVLHKFLATTGVAIVVDFILNSLKTIANQMVDADSNHQGVYLKFQQFFIPLGFNAR